MIAIIKYNAGNSRSVQNAVSRLGYESIVTDEKDEINEADYVIFPGVGHAGTAMNYLKNRGLDQVILQLEQPFLGICLGLQLMCEHSEEGDTECLGIFDANIKRFPPNDIIPHIGWNDFEQMDGPLFNGLQSADHFYFVHSYYAEICDSSCARCNYIHPFSAALQKDNFYGVQFHPEKSGAKGEQLLNNFLKL